MPLLLWRSPDGREMLNPSFAELEEAILHSATDYWSQGSGGAMAVYQAPDGGIVTLLVSPNPEHGIYLQYIEGQPPNRRIWLTLSDEGRLHEVAEANDEWFASVGLFLPPTVAWVGIREFCLHGQRSTELAWITPDAIPPDGNY